MFSACGNGGIIKMNRIKRLAAATMSVVVLSGVCVFGSGMTARAKSTGAGLAADALEAY